MRRSESTEAWCGSAGSRRMARQNTATNGKTSAAYTPPKGRPTPSKKGTRDEARTRHARRSRLEWAVVAAIAVALVGLLVAFGPNWGGNGGDGRRIGVHGG